MGEARLWTIDQIKEFQFNKEVLIDGFMYRGDCIFVKAKKKVGKSVFTQHVAHVASTGDKFFGEYCIPKPLRVAYIFNEMTIMEWKQRINNMEKSRRANKDNLIFIECNYVKMYTDEGRDLICHMLEAAGGNFDLILWDCFYKFIVGKSINDDVAVGLFNMNEEVIRKHFNASSIIVHHDTEKQYTDRHGGKHDGASIGNAMGSSLILAHPTQVYTLTRHSDGRDDFIKMKLGERRSGQLIDELTYRLVAPEDNEEERLDIDIDYRDVDSNYQTVKRYIKNNGKCKKYGFTKRIKKEMDMDCSDETVRRVIKKLMDEKIIEFKDVDNSPYIAYTQSTCSISS